MDALPPPRTLPLRPERTAARGWRRLKTAADAPRARHDRPLGARAAGRAVRLPVAVLAGCAFWQVRRSPRRSAGAYAIRRANAPGVFGLRPVALAPFP